MQLHTIYVKYPHLYAIAYKTGEYYSFICKNIQPSSKGKTIL